MGSQGYFIGMNHEDLVRVLWNIIHGDFVFYGNIGIIGISWDWNYMDSFIGSIFFYGGILGSKCDMSLGFHGIS